VIGNLRPVETRHRPGGQGSRGRDPRPTSWIAASNAWVPISDGLRPSARSDYVPPNQQSDVPHFASYVGRAAAIRLVIIEWVGSTDRAIRSEDMAARRALGLPHNAHRLDPVACLSMLFRGIPQRPASSARHRLRSQWAVWRDGQPRRGRIGMPARRKRLATVCASIPYSLATLARDILLPYCSAGLRSS